MFCRYDGSLHHEYVKPTEPLEAKISALYNKIKKPVMTDLALAFEGVRMTKTYPQELPDLFAGGQIVLVGRYDKGARTKMKVSGKLQGEKQKFDYKVVLAASSETSRNKFVERLWAVRRIGFLLDQIQLNGENKEVIDELIRLSMTYGIMTPYTSFLADETAVAAGASYTVLRRKANKEAARLAESVTDAAGQMAAQTRGKMNKAKRAPAPAGPSKAGEGVRQYGNTSQDKYEAGREERVANVQNVGGQTLYRRGRTWVTPETAKLDLVKDADKIVDVERFSKFYFKLVSDNTIAENQILASQRGADELIVKFRGQVYRVK